MLPLQVVHAGFLTSQKPIFKTGGAGSTVRIALIPAAVITGKIVDDEGFPVESSVSAMRYGMEKGERKLELIALAQSDDLGRYRLSNLAAGRYWIRAGSGSAGNWDRRYVARYYPGTLRPEDSGQVDAEAGQEQAGIDIQLTRYGGVTLSGRVEMPAETTQWLSPILLQPDPADTESYYAPQQRDGSFVIRHVAPGDYTVRANPATASPGQDKLVAEQKLRVGDTDERDIILKPHILQSVDVAGALVMQGGGSPPPMHIRLQPNTGTGASAQPSEDGSFVLKGLLPGHYEIRVAPDIKMANGTIDFASIARAGYAVSAQLGDLEVLDSGFDLDGPPTAPLRITVSTHVIEIEGKLLDTTGEPISGALLVAMSGAEGRAVAATEAGGIFRLVLRNPGDYHIYLGGQVDLNDPDSVKKHESDFPLLKVADGVNPPLLLRVPAQP